MASVASLREHLIEELNDLLNAEQQLIKALPKMAERASRKELQRAFRRHLAETKTHERRVAQALQTLGEEASGETCEAMEGLLEEGQELMSSGEPGGLLDAMLITAAQKVEHYEIASYGTVRTYANVLGEKKVAQLLAQNLKDEKNADKTLTSIAEGSVNKQAAREWHEQQTAEGMIQKGAAWIGATVGGVAKRVMPTGGRNQGRSQAADRGNNRSRATRASRTNNGRSSGSRSPKR
jgi:ferritin-like metal-binding protein YciE